MVLFIYPVIERQPRIYIRQTLLLKQMLILCNIHIGASRTTLL